MYWYASCGRFGSFPTLTAACCPSLLLTAIRNANRPVTPFFFFSGNYRLFSGCAHCFNFFCAFQDKRKTKAQRSEHKKDKNKCISNILHFTLDGTFKQFMSSHKIDSQVPLSGIKPHDSVTLKVPCVAFFNTCNSSVTLLVCIYKTIVVS